MNNERGLRRTARVTDGLFRQNVVLMSGLLISPVIAGATTFENAAVLSAGFALITFPTVLLCRFIPRRIVYTIRIIAYAITASAFYIPVILLLNSLFSVTASQKLGIYLPVLVTNPVILSKTETRFYLRSYKTMTLEILGYIAGFAVPCLLIGIIRDILVNSSVGWISADAGFTVPALETTFGGFILVGVTAGLFRALYNRSKKRLQAKNVKL